MNDVQPMPSTQIGNGVYEVIGTTHNCVVQRAYGEGLRHNGWHLIVDGEWWQTFATKREALQACQENPEL